MSNWNSKEIRKLTETIKQLGPIETEILISNAQVLLARQQIGQQLESKKMIGTSKLRHKKTNFQNSILQSKDENSSHI